MAADYISSTPISRPPVLPNYPPDVNLGSIGFSYGLGLVYQVFSEPSLIKLPPSMGQ